jgi:hypothetical protein
VNIKSLKMLMASGLAASAFAALGASPALAHHSFAMYDQTKTLTMTGVMYQFVAQANHAELHFYLVGPDGKLQKGADGKPVPYGVEMMGAAAVAEQGITADSMKSGTILSVKVNPMRDGSNFGSKAGASALAVCPWKTPPAAGKTCDTVAGHQLMGANAF